MAPFQRLVRFRSTSGAIVYGEAGLKAVSKDALIGQTVRVYQGNGPWNSDFGLTDRMETIDEVLCPLEAVPMFICVGLNYRQHAAEAGFPITPYPVIFTKPPGKKLYSDFEYKVVFSQHTDALAGPFEDIPIHSECKFLDYEAELCFIIGTDCKNVTDDEDEMQYVLGYTAGNDVSSRYWQAPERSGNQHGSAKSFDKFAPIGPIIASREAIRDPHNLSIKLFVNGAVRQSANTDDLIYSIPTIIRHISRGTTLRRGTVVMTGTPSGVAAFMKPPAWLEHGDVVEVEIAGIGRMRNKMTFEK